MDDFTEDISEYVKKQTMPTILEKVLLNIDKKRAIDLMIKHFNGEGNAFFGKTDDVMAQIKNLLSSISDNPEDTLDSLFEDWEKDNVLSMPYAFVEMNDEGVDRLEGYYFDDVEDMLEDTEPYLNAAAISDEVNRTAKIAI